MNLSHGGHLTHGHKVNFSGRLSTVVPYGVSEKTEQLREQTEEFVQAFEAVRLEYAKFKEHSQ